MPAQSPPESQLIVAAIRYVVQEHVLWAEINRPEVHNAINFEVMTGLEAVLARAEADPEIRALVLTGVGETAFAAGGDIKQFAELHTAEQAAEMAQRMKAILDRLEHLPCWTIACLNGAAFGGGWETALAFDFCIMSDTAKIGFTQRRFHLLPGWGGVTRLVERVGRSVAMRWLAECAVIDAAAAQTAGLVDRLEPAENVKAAAWQWALQLQRTDRDMIESLKQAGLYAREMPRSQAIAAELAPFVRFWAAEEHHRRVQAFLHDV